MEELKLLGIKPSIDLEVFICKHKALLPSYRDIYPQSLQSNSVCISESELKILEKRRAVRPERKYCVSASSSLKKLLIGTTMLPKPIVDYILEKVGVGEPDEPETAGQ